MNQATSRQLILEVAGTDQDFEFYPTTGEIIQTIKQDMREVERMEAPSILDCGAGDGRVLKALTEGDKYAIEKSRPLLDALDPSIFVVGTEFREQALIDKKVDMIFCNPPYSEYDIWARRIIREGNAGVVYLVIPDRWDSNEGVLEAISARDAQTEVLGAFDFESADRRARCHVNILKVMLRRERDRYSYGRDIAPKVDPFRLWFEENFELKTNEQPVSKHAWESAAGERMKEQLQGELVKGRDIAQALEEMYTAEKEKLFQTYKKLEDIDADLLSEMDINLDGVRSALKLKYDSLKDRYWKELFDNLDRVISRLTTESRNAMLKVLMEHTHVDFTASNVYAILVWVIKNANQYFDTQLVELVRRMTELACIKTYKSNERTFGQENWRFNRHDFDLGEYALDYRIVLDRWHLGIETEQWQYERGCGLKDSGVDLVEDIRTVASNLGYDAHKAPGLGGARSRQWEPGKPQEFWCRNQRTGEHELLFEAKAHKKGTLHLKLHPDFIMRLNVEFGRLQGWVRSWQEAVDEMDIPAEVAAEAFQSNLRLDASLLLPNHTGEA